MAKINLETEIVGNHTDEEMIEFFDSILTGVLKNYRTAALSNRSELLWGSLGDISMVASLVREMKKRNIARQTPRSDI